MVAALMVERGIHHVVVADRNGIVGVVSSLDLVRTFLPDDRRCSGLTHHANARIPTRVGVLLNALYVGALAASPLLAPGAHLSGGIGEEDQERMRLSQNLYNLRLTFAEAGTGAYLTGVDVLIEPLGPGRPFGPYKDCGPLLHVVLGPGPYRVRATYRGIDRTVDVRIAKGTSASTLYWPILPD